MRPMPPTQSTPAGSAPGGSLRRRSGLVTLVLGSAAGIVIGLYVHRWWGAGLFVASSLISAVALAGIGLVVVIAIVEGSRGHRDRAGIAFILALTLAGGTVVGAQLGPGYQPASDYAGTVTVHVTAPIAADWSGQGFCWTKENSSEVGGLWIGTWSGPGSPTEGHLGFLDSGSPTFSFGREGTSYDLLGSPRPNVEVRDLAPSRLAGDVAFIGLPARGPGLLSAFPGQPLDGHVSWSCDTTRPAR